MPSAQARPTHWPADRLATLLREEPDQYAIEVDGLDPVPPFFVRDSATNGRIRGTIPAVRLHEFMELTHQSGAFVRSCTLKRATLEESFLHLLKTGEETRV